MTSNALNLVRYRAAQPVLPETMLITIICFVDMAWTITAIQLGIAKESNPLLAVVIEHGMIAFAVVKMLSFLLPLGGLEMLRAKIPAFVSKGLRVGLASYVVLYIFGTLHVHHFV